MNDNNESLLTRYILNSSFHGFRYIAEPNRHWTERIFWIICCSISWLISGVVIHSTWNSFQDSAITFVVETSYTDWDTEFPTIYVCEVDNEDKIATLSDRAKNLPKYQMISNKVRGPGSLTIELGGHNKVYVLGPLEVPSVITSRHDFIQLVSHTYAKRTFSIKEIENQPEVRDLTIQQRKCRYAEENYLDVFPYYSYSACLMQCRKDAQLKKCGCAHHLMPNTSVDKQCSFSGLACLQQNFQELMVQKPPGSKKLGLECDCRPSCTEMQLDVVTESKVGFSEDFSVLELSLERLPSERYKRNVVKGLVDVVVSIGSVTALFLGASFLSFVEIFFYFLIRPLNDYLKLRNTGKK